MTGRRFSKQLVGEYIAKRTKGHDFDPGDGWKQAEDRGEAINRDYGGWRALLDLADYFDLTEDMRQKRKLDIGAVSFGEPSDTNSARWKHTFHIGPARVALLQLVLDGKPLPEPLFLVGQCGGGSYERIGPEDIDWKTSSLRPSKAVKEKK